MVPNPELRPALFQGARAYTPQKKNGKKESRDPMRAWIKSKGEAPAELVLPLLFTVDGHVRSPHILVAFFVVLLQESPAGQPERLFCIMTYSRPTLQSTWYTNSRILPE